MAELWTWAAMVMTRGGQRVLRVVLGAQGAARTAMVAATHAPVLFSTHKTEREKEMEIGEERGKEKKDDGGTRSPRWSKG